MTPAHAVRVKNIKNAAVLMNKGVDLVIEFDELKVQLQAVKIQVENLGDSL